MRVNSTWDIVSYCKQVKSYRDYHELANGTFRESDRAAVEAALAAEGHTNLSVTLAAGVIRVSGKNPNVR